MAKRQTKLKVKLGRSNRYPSDYDLRDRESEERDKDGRNRSWTPGNKGQGGEGLSKGYGGSPGKGTGPSGPERK